MLASQIARALTLAMDAGTIAPEMTMAELAHRLGEEEPSAGDSFWSLMCASCGTVGVPDEDAQTLICTRTDCPEYKVPWTLPRRPAK